MLIQVPAINDESRKIMRGHIEKEFKFKQGRELDDVVSEVLNDKDLFMFLAMFLPTNKGIQLGSTSYWDDIHVDVFYGLTLNFNQTTRKTHLFFYDSVSSVSEMEQMNLTTSFSFPYDKSSRYISDFRGWPTGEEFANEVNSALRNPKERLIKLNYENA